jgi:hypothetical protein
MIENVDVKPREFDGFIRIELILGWSLLQLLEI